MPLIENHHVKTEREAMHKRLLEGLSAGVEIDTYSNMPIWIQEIYSKHGPYERGLLLGILLEELEKGEKLT